MTTLPSLPSIDDLFKPDPLDLVPEQPVRPPRKVREVATDTLIKANRAATPAAVADQRANKRMSIGELNSLDLPTLMERYQATPYDDRGPVTRFLDLLDLPRNIIAGTAFPSIRRRKEAEGDVGTAGLGNVRFSDILDEMGVAPGIIRGVAGFIGDVAMDPLTYVGPAGWGAKLVGTGGKAIEVTAAGRRALESGIRSAARGAPVADEAVASVLRAAGYGAEQIATKRGAKNAKDFAGEIRNAVLGQSSDGKFGTAMSWLGGDVGTKGSVIADAFHSPIKSEMSEAARAFVAKHGTAAAPGIGLGVGPVGAKSAIAHIPFTSYGLYVPAFTGSALEAGRIAAQANSAFSTATGPIGEQVGSLGDLASRVAATRDEFRALMDEKDLATTPEDLDRINAQIGDLRDRIKAHHDAASNVVFGPQGQAGLAPGTQGNRLESIGDVLWQNDQMRKIEADAAEVLAENKDTLDTVRKRRQILMAVSKDVKEGIPEADAVSKLEPSQRALLDMSDEESSIMEGIADSVHQEFAIKKAQADAMRGTLLEAANRTDNRDLADIAADMIGLGPTTGGYSAFTPLRTVTRSIFGDDHTVTQYANRKFDALDEWTRKMFGMTQGEAGRVRRQLEVSRGPVGKAAFANKHRELQEQVADALKRAGLPEDRWQEAMDLTTALAINERMKNGEAWSIEGSPILDMLQRAKEGPLAGTVNDLTEIAKRNLGMLDRMGMDELASKILEEQRPGYFPGKATIEGADILGGLDRNAQARPGAIPGPLGKEGFERPKSMTRAIWTDANGTKHDLYQMEHDFYSRFLDESGNLSKTGENMLLATKQQDPSIADFNRDFWAKRDWQPGEMEQASKSLSKFEQAIVRSKLYNELPESAKIGTASFKQVDPFLLNQEFPNRMGMMVPGNTIPRGMFETSFAELMATRAESHERAMIAANAKMIFDQHAAAISKQAQNLAIKEIQQGKDSAVLTMSNGAKATIEKGTAENEYIFKIGDQKYRKLRGAGEVSDALNELGAGLYDRATLDAVLPEKVAEAYERLAPVIKNPHTFLDAYDNFLRYWKTFTLAHPSWIIGDVAGGLIQSLAAGANPVKLIKALPDAFRLGMASDKPSVLKNMRVALAGKSISAEEAMALAVRMSVPSGHVHGESFAKLVEGGFYVPEYQTRLMTAESLRDPVNAVKGRIKDMRARAAATAKRGFDSTVWAKIPNGQKFREAKQLVMDEGFVRNLLSPFMAMNARANDTLRLATWMALMDDGHDAAGAAAKVMESMFDVADLSKFETETMKRLIPFYSWMKHSGVYWTKRLMQNPALANMAPRVKRAIEEGLYGDDSVPDHLRPNWMRDQLALQIGADPTKRYALTLGTAIPQETAYAVGAAAASPITGAMGLKQMLEQVGFGLALPLKAAFELASGREAFSGRSISFSPNEGDLSVGEYLAGQVRPLRELGVGNIRQGPIQKAIESGPLTGASRLLLGGRSQPFDDDRIRQNIVKQFKDSEQQVRKRITIAEREKNQRASLDARATLMRLYDTMVQRGLDEEVPAWARLQLEELHAGR